MTDKKINLGKGAKISVGASLLLVAVSIFYFAVVFIPQKQKATIELSKIEQEAKIEQAKAEQMKAEQAKAELEKLQAEQIEQQVAQDKPATAPQPKQSTTSTALQSCLATADANYQKKLSKENLCKKGYYCDKAALAAVTNALLTERGQDRDECYRKYR